MQDNPLVSVIVPCYNHDKYVEQCILSIVNQTYKEIELIVIDDGSIDSSPQIIEKLSVKYKFCYERQANKGLPKTLNYAIKKYATGKYISLIASDDYWELDKIKKQVTFMKLHPECGMCFGMAKIVNVGNNITGTLGENLKEADFKLENLLLENKIPALTAFFRRDVFYEVGGYDEHLYIEDWDLWLKIAEHYKIGMLKEFLAYYRVHSSNISSNDLQMIIAQREILDKWKFHSFYKKANKRMALKEIAIYSVLDKRKAFLLIVKNMRLLNKASLYISLAKLCFKIKK